MSTVARPAPAPSPKITLLHPQLLLHSAHFHYGRDGPRVTSQRLLSGPGQLTPVCFVPSTVNDTWIIAVHPISVHEVLLADYATLTGSRTT